MKTRSYPWFAILSMFLILFLMPGLFQIHPRAGRGRSYRSGSSSSSRSSGSSYSGSSSSFSSHRYSGSSYSGSHSSSSSTSYAPVKTETYKMNLREYNVWITVKENGSIHVHEKFYWKGDPYDKYTVFNRKISFRSQPWEIVPESVIAKGDFSSIKYDTTFSPMLKLTLKKSSKPDALHIIEYEIQNGFYETPQDIYFEYPFHLDGVAEKLYFEVRTPTQKDLDLVSFDFGNYFSMLPHRKGKKDLWTTPVDPKRSKDNQAVFFSFSNASNVGFRVQIHAAKGKYPVAKQNLSHYAFTHKNAEYELDIHPNGIIDNKGTFVLEKIAPASFQPMILFPDKYVLSPYDENNTGGIAFSQTLDYQVLENLSEYENMFGFWYTFPEPLDKNRKYTYKMRCFRCMEKTKNGYVASIHLPLALRYKAMSGFSVFSQNMAMSEHTKVRLNLPPGVNPGRNNVTVYLGSYEGMGSSFPEIHDRSFTPGKGHFRIRFFPILDVFNKKRSVDGGDLSDSVALGNMDHIPGGHW